MIKLDISTIIFFYILFSVICTLFLWALFGYKGVGRRPAGDEDYILKCSVCFYSYIDSRREDISVCPVCGSYNKKTEVKR